MSDPHIATCYRDCRLVLGLATCECPPEGQFDAMVRWGIEQNALIGDAVRAFVPEELIDESIVATPAFVRHAVKALRAERDEFAAEVASLRGHGGRNAVNVATLRIRAAMAITMTELERDDRTCCESAEDAAHMDGVQTGAHDDSCAFLRIRRALDGSSR